MKVQKNIEVWLVKKRLPRPIDLVQYDTGIQLVFAIKDFTIPGGTTGTLYVQKPSGKFVYQETGITASENSITIDLENQAITEHGNDIPYQVRLQNGKDLITTFAGIFRVEKSLADDGAVKSETVVAAFEAKTAEQLAKIEAETLDQIALVQAASQTEQEAIEDKGLEVLNTIPADYTATAALAEKAIREKGSAIVCEAEGEIITVADASDDHVRGLKLLGKTEQIKTTGAQMFDKSTAVTGMLEEDGSVTPDGAYFTSDFIPIVPKTAYHQTEKQSVRAKYYDANKEPLSDTWDVQITTEATFTTFANAYFIRLTVSAHVVDRFMLNVGTTGLPYEPYSGGAPSPSPEYPQSLDSVGSAGSIAAKVLGANLFDVKNATIREGNGLTGTINADGSITVNGTPTGNYAQVCSGTIRLPKGKYFVSGGKNAAGCAYFQLYANKADGSQKYAINGVFEVDGTEAGDVHYSIQSGNNLDPINNYKLYPMFNVGEIQMEFEPYKPGGTVTAQTPNGLPGIPVSSGGNYTDANGQQWICDEVDFARGVYVQRVLAQQCTAFIASNISPAPYRFRTPHLAQKIKPLIGLCNITTHSGTAWGTGAGLATNVEATGHGIIYINLPDKFTTADEINAYAAENPIVVLAALETPIETPLSAEEIVAFKALHTNKPNTTVYNDGGAHMALEYNADTKLYIDNKFAELAAAIVNNA